MGPCRRSYILFVRKFWTSEMFGKWSPTSKLSDIKLSHYPDRWYIFFTWTKTYLSILSIKLVFWYLQIFSRVCFDWVLSIGWHVNLPDLGVSLRLSMFSIIFQCFCGLVFLMTLLEFSLIEFPRGFFSVYFLLGLRKKDTGKKSLQKMFLQTLKNFKTLWSLFMDGVQLPQGYGHFEGAVYFLPLIKFPESTEGTKLMVLNVVPLDWEPSI